MNPPKVNEFDYINFLIAAQKVYSCIEAERVQPESANAAAHDAITRLLHRLEPSSEQLWQEARSEVQLSQGVLVVDDSTLDKCYAQKMELVTRHWSGKHGRVVQGINLVTLLWSEGDRHIPLDYRFYEKRVDGATKNDHFRSMLATAKERGFAPQCVVFDSWYSSLDNLKGIRGAGHNESGASRTPGNSKQRPAAADPAPGSRPRPGADRRTQWGTCAHADRATATGVTQLELERSEEPLGKRESHPGRSPALPRTN